MRIDRWSASRPAKYLTNVSFVSLVEWCSEPLFRGCVISELCCCEDLTETRAKLLWSCWLGGSKLRDHASCGWKWKFCFNSTSDLPPYTKTCVKLWQKRLTKITVRQMARIAYPRNGRMFVQTTGTIDGCLWSEWCCATPPWLRSVAS